MRSSGWKYEGTSLEPLSLDELHSIYEGMEMLGEAGHSYARTMKNVDYLMECDHMALHPTVKFGVLEFWTRYIHAKSDSSIDVFYFWGHSYELISDEMWADFEEKSAPILADPDVETYNVVDLF